jgi:hypothetical protein
MRLINTTTMQLEEFMANPPPYAALSHTWEDGEVTFQDFAHPDRTVASTKNGITKIQHTCRQAKQTGIGYAGVDTCCIWECHLCRQFPTKVGVYAAVNDGPCPWPSNG